MLFVRASARYWSQLLGRRREETLEAEPQVGGGHHLAKQLVAHFTSRYDLKKRNAQNTQKIAKTLHTKIRWSRATGGGRPELRFVHAVTAHGSANFLRAV